MSGLFSTSLTEARGLVATNTSVAKTAIVIGCASTAVGLSPFYYSGQSAKTAEGYGDAVDTLCQIIEQVQPAGAAAVKIPAALYTCAGTTAGSYGTINVTGVTGTSVATVDSTVKPYGTYEAQIKVITGGTVGTAGIVIAYSLDGGRNWTTGIALGTANNYTIPGSNCKFNFAAGTLVANDIIKVRTFAPAPSASDITDAFAAIAASSLDAGVIVCEFPCTATLAAAVSSGLSTLRTVGKRAVALCRTKLPAFETSETESAWLSSVATDFIAFADSAVCVRAVYGLITDAMTGRQYLRSDLAQWAADVVRVSIEQVPNVPADRKEANFSLIDANGTTVGHDEGPRGAATGLSNQDQGNRFSCVQRLADFSRREDVYSTVPWVMYSADERIRTLNARRVANEIERTAISAGNSALGSIVKYYAANGAVPAQLTESARLSIQGTIFNRLAQQFQGVIQNASDAAVDTGLVQVSPTISVAAGGLVTVNVTLAPKFFGILQTLNLTLSVQE